MWTGEYFEQNCKKLWMTVNRAHVVCGDVPINEAMKPSHSQTPSYHLKCEEKGIVARDYCLGLPGHRHWGPSGRQTQATITCYNPFLLHVVGQSGLKFLSPNSFSTMAKITPLQVLLCKYRESTNRNNPFLLNIALHLWK